MGLSNVATALSTTIAVSIGGPLIDILNRTLGVGMGPRLELLLAFGYFLVGALLLRPVVEPARSSGSEAVLTAPTGPGSP
jgi:hypothetical protein